MTRKKLFWTISSVDQFTKQLEQIETLDGGWTTRYIDKRTGQEWLKYPVDPDRGMQYNLIPYNPLLSTDELVDIAFTSQDPDEVDAASHRLYHEEFYDHKESRPILLKRLKDAIGFPLAKNERIRLQKIIQIARLLDNVNHREIVGKHYTEVEADAKYYRLTAAEARLIIDFLSR